MSGQNVGYKRVSSADQNTNRQLDGLELDKVFEDKISGKNLDRPALTQCIEYIREGDTLYVHSIDRLARNLHDLEELVEKITGKGVTLHFKKENLIFSGDKTNPIHVMMLQVVGAIAQFERSLIKERQKEGIEKAKNDGKRFGKPRKLTSEQENELIRRYAAHECRAKLAREYGLSKSGFYGIVSRMKSSQKCSNQNEQQHN